MVDYWHGSPVALVPGTHLTSIRERRGATFGAAQYQYLASNAHDPDLSYFTTDRDLALAWCVRSNGALLRVEPVGPIEPDPDFKGTSFSAAEAIVREVVEHRVKMGHLAARRAFASYEPNSFDEKGFIRPAERLGELLAVSGGDVRKFHVAGRYPNPQRFSWRAGSLRYLTDDLELIVTNKLLIEVGGGLPEQIFQQCLSEARATWPEMQPIPWI
jgi:hypothetical protein